MFLERLRLFNFRCYDQIEIEPDPRFNVITGLNGHGKTSVLESIGLLAFLKSFRNGKNDEILKIGTTEGLIHGRISHENLNFDLDVKLWPHRKQALFNKKASKLLSEYVGKLSAVSFSPSDLEIIRGEPENRRHWMDKLSTVLSTAHVDNLLSYKRVLEQRNKLLKQYSERRLSALPEDFSVWTEELHNLGAQVIHKRIHSVDNSVDKIRAFYSQISGEDVELNMRYSSKIFEGSAAFASGQEREFSIELIRQFLLKSAQLLYSKELVLGTTLVGPHRDDLEIFFGSNPVKAYGSQGEIRSLVLAMRLAETEAYKMENGFSPILLIDDFSSELDSHRRAFLLDYLTSSSSQVFLTTTEEISLGKVFFAKEGKVSNGYGIDSGQVENGRQL